MIAEMFKGAVDDEVSFHLGEKFVIPDGSVSIWFEGESC